MSKLGPYELNTIVTGDARVLAEAIPDNSVDLIFTDPVYQNIEDYEWLAWTAARVLKPGGNCLAFTNAKWLSRLLSVVHTDHPVFSYQRASATNPMNGKIIAKTHYVVWLVGDENIIGYFPDGYLSTNWTENHKADSHRWTKNPKYLKRVLESFTNSGAIILDPFTGGGTVPAVCKMLSRNYLAFEVDPATAALARERVLLTQAPLFVMPQPEQLALMEGEE